MTQIQRTFIPGSKWIYIKIYMGIRTSDTILSKDILFVINNLKKESSIEKWFFIRYSDPDYHLRIRILVRDELFIANVICAFYRKLNSLVEDGIIWKIQLDTYNRELERYNPNLIKEVESLFFFDSDCIVKILRKVEKSNNENYRWMISLVLIDQFLSDFSYNLKEKCSILENMSNAFKIEFGFNEYNSKQLNSKFRKNRKTITSVIEKSISDITFEKLYYDVNIRSKMSREIVNAIKDKCNKKKISLENLLTSYIHMTLNRLFRTKNRIHELIIYDFMFRYYDSKIAQEKYNTRIK